MYWAFSVLRGHENMDPYKNEPMVKGTKIKYDGNLVLYNQKIMQRVTVTKYESHDFRGNVHTLLLDKVSSLTGDPSTLVEY